MGNEFRKSSRLQHALFGSGWAGLGIDLKFHLWNNPTDPRKKKVQILSEKGSAIAT
jgi:hypothetical protein